VECNDNYKLLYSYSMARINELKQLGFKIQSNRLLQSNTKEQHSTRGKQGVESRDQSVGSILAVVRVCVRFRITVVVRG
jgi:hypothetical protein